MNKSQDVTGIQNDVMEIQRQKYKLSQSKNISGDEAAGVDSPNNSLGHIQVKLGGKTKNNRYKR